MSLREKIIFSSLSLIAVFLVSLLIFSDQKTPLLGGVRPAEVQLANSGGTEIGTAANPVRVSSGASSYTIGSVTGTINLGSAIWTASSVTGTATVTQGTAAAQSSRWPVFLSDGVAAFGSLINPFIVDLVSSTAYLWGGVFDDTGSQTVTENGTSSLRITNNRALHVNLRNALGQQIGVTGNAVSTTFANDLVLAAGSNTIGAVTGTIGFSGTSSVVIGTKRSQRGIYNFSIGDITGVAAVQNYLSIFNVGTSTAFIRRLNHNIYSDGAAPTRNSMLVIFTTSTTGGTVQATSSIFRHRQIYAPPQLLQIRTANPTVTLGGSQIFNFPPPMTMSGAGINYDRFEWQAKKEDEEIELEPNQGLYFRTDVAGDINVGYGFDLEWGEVLP